MASPNPSRITDPLWRMWTDRPIARWRLGGILAYKCSYHAPRYWVINNCGNHYSIRLSLDDRGPSNKAAAIDYTMSDAEMRRRTGYLRNAVNRNDPRLAAVREFYGTLNGSTVYGRIKDNRGGPWRWSTADSSHLWHIHISIFRAYVDDWQELEPILSVLSGESLEDWERRGEGMSIIGLSKGDSGQDVKGLQSLIRRTGRSITVDGVYGDETADLVLEVRRSVGSSVDSGDSITGWAFTQIMQAVIDRRAGMAADEAVSALKRTLESQLHDLSEQVSRGNLPSAIIIDIPPITVPIDVDEDEDDNGTS